MRKPIQVDEDAKRLVEGVKAQLGLRSESDAIKFAFLVLDNLKELPKDAMFILADLKK